MMKRTQRGLRSQLTSQESVAWQYGAVCLESWSKGLDRWRPRDIFTGAVTSSRDVTFSVIYFNVSVSILSCCQSIIELSCISSISIYLGKPSNRKSPEFSGIFPTLVNPPPLELGKIKLAHSKQYFKKVGKMTFF